MLNSLPQKVRIVEVGPRDGLQNEAMTVSTKDKVEYIKLLIASGIKAIEVTSFVREDKIPQMADASELYKELLKNKIDIEMPCLVPNTVGLEKAIEAGVKEIAVFTSTSNTFNQKNINTDIDGSLDRLRDVSISAQKNGIKVRGYVSTAFGCPYEGKTSLDTLKAVINRLMDFNVYEVSIGDTIGVANPKQVYEMITDLKNHFDLHQLALHFHDTRGMAVANVTAGLGVGITSFDSSSGGLGGCPYAKGATGNVATEDLVYLFDSLGIETGINIDELAKASMFMLKKVGRDSSSKFLTAYMKGKS